MTPPSGHLVVFTGPSLDVAGARELLPAADVAAPIARGDLEHHMVAGARSFLIIDGVFAHRLAAAPAEFVAALEAGARIVGAASMGAIRAAECWPAGMLGVGAVYRLYRWRAIADDDEVAVAVDPDDGFAAVSDALINIRWGLLAALRMNLLTREHAGEVLSAARGTHFSERRLATVFESAGVRLTRQLRAVFASTDIKRRDALRAADAARALPAADDRIPRRAPRIGRTRAIGHHPALGYSASLLHREVPRWLLATGRYRRYVRDAGHGRDPEEACRLLWAELTRTGTIDTEIMRWHAVRSVSRSVPEATDLDEAHTIVAGAHGYQHWDELAEAAASGQLGAIPLEWIEQGCRELARARNAIQARAIAIV